MKFKISRSSDWSGTKSPCEKAEKVESVIPAQPEINGTLPDLNLSGLQTGQMEYVIPAKPEQRKTEWFIEINSLDELFELIQEVGHIIIDDDPKSIEIYDDWRE